MAKKKNEKVSIDSLIEAVNEPERILREAIPEHEQVFDDAKNALKKIKGKKRSAVSIDNKRLLYMRSAELFTYLLHVKGDSLTHKDEYRDDLIGFKDNFKTRLEYVETFLKLGAYIDHKLFSRNKIMEKWRDAKKAALDAVQFSKRTNVNINNRDFKKYINNSFDDLVRIKGYLVNLYDRILKS